MIRLRTEIFTTHDIEALLRLESARRFSPLGGYLVDDETRAEVGRSMGKSREDMEAVRLMMERSHARAAISIAYFGSFHAATAALRTQGVKSAKRSNVKAAFNVHLVRPGFIEPEYARLLVRLRVAREEADFWPERCDVSAGAVDPLIADAERFVARMERYLKDVGAMD